MYCNCKAKRIRNMDDIKIIDVKRCRFGGYICDCCFHGGAGEDWEPLKGDHLGNHYCERCHKNLAEILTKKYNLSFD